MRRRWTPDHAIYLAAALLVLLAALAWLQYRWIGEVSRAEQERMRANLEIAVARFADDFDREISRAFALFQPGSASGAFFGAEDRYDRWRSESPYPDLVKAVFVVRPGDPVEIERLDPATRTWEGLEHAPAEIAPALRRIAERMDRTPGPQGPVVDEIPAIIVPLEREPRLPGPFEPGRADFVIVQFDVDVIANDLLPDVARVNFTAPWGGDYRLNVVRDLPGSQQVVLYRSDASEGLIEHPDVARPLFMLHAFQSLQPFDRGFAGNRPGAGPRFGAPDGRPAAAGPNPIPEARSSWRVVVEHRLGSLAEAVARNRRRNFAISLGVLGILATSIVVLALSIRRTQQISDQQMEFIAGVTHELNTPLAAIHSAGQNLADGIVRDESQTRRYGSMIVDQSRRLSNMVGEVLEFSGLLRGERNYHFTAVNLQHIIGDSIGDLSWLIGEREAKTEVRIPRDLPSVRGDADALRRVFDNLLGNAIKHGNNSVCVVVRATTDRSNRAVTITVEDDGPGIASTDITRIFEPFYRGHDAARRQARGSGLGLSIVRGIVEAHRGRVSVESRAGKGTRFTVSLPIHEEGNGRNG